MRFVKCTVPDSQSTTAMNPVPEPFLTVRLTVYL